MNTIRIKWRIVEPSAPGVEPLTTDEVREHTKVSLTAENSYLDYLVKVARCAVEEYISRYTTSRTVTLYLDRLPYSGTNSIILPRSASLNSINSFQYAGGGSKDVIDSSLVQDVGYLFDTPTDYQNIRVYPPYGETWPSVNPSRNSVKIEYNAGFLDPADVPPGIRHAMLLIVDEMYSNRGNSSVMRLHDVPHSAKRLLRPHKVEWYGCDGGPRV